MKKYLRYNSMTALLLRVAEVISGFILPRFILKYYGSATNGLVSSITQFLSVIGFLDMGTTAVVISALYHPIVNCDQPKINQIVSAARDFFRKIAYVLIGYVIVLCIIFPWISDNSFSALFNATLIAAMAIGTFGQYYSGLVDQIFLSANQKEFIYSTACIIAVLLNTGCGVALITMGASIQVVKLATSLIYLLRPIITRLYIRRNYSLDRKAPFSKDTIPQRWNGIAQHIAFRILTGTDTIVLTIFSTLSNVSVYAVYNLVTNGVYLLLYSLTNGLKPRLGHLWAEKKYQQVQEEYKWFEWQYHVVISFVFGCVLALLLPFVLTYTSGITDANYDQVVFAILISCAYAALCMAQFGIIIIQAVNHYKQTQIFYIISAIINVGVSIILVIRFGLIGVSIGTLCAMLFQYGWTQWYMAKKLFHIKLGGAWKQIFTDALIMFVGFLLTSNFEIGLYTYMDWIILAAKTALAFVPVVVLINLILYPKNVVRFVKLRLEKRGKGGNQ